MKKILTIISTREIAETEDGAVEFFTAQSAEETVRALKSAKGRYTAFSNYAEIAETEQVTTYLANSNADIIKLNDCMLFKTSTLKDVKGFLGVFDLCAFAAMDSKSIESAPLNLFTIASTLFGVDADGVLRVCAEFKRVKAKLQKDIYTFVSAYLTDYLVRYYAQSLLKIRNKEITAEEFAETDKTIKSDIVLYHALETKFTFAKLSKLREKNFKISFIASRKLKKFLS